MYLERDDLETDPRFRQVIPYDVVTGDGMTLSYQRKGSEDRLHAFRSIGIGGHVEEPETVEHGMLRELREEIGIVVDIERIKWHGFILLSETEVDKVHMGVVYSYDVGGQELHFGEEIRDPQWIDMLGDRYEPWSIEAWKMINGQA